MPKYYAFFYHKVALFLSILTSLQHKSKISKTNIKRGTKNKKLIHKNLHDFLNELLKNSHHISLKSSKGITQSKRHLHENKCPIRTSDCDLFLIHKSNVNFILSWITIKKPIMRITYNPIKCWVNKRKWKMIFFSSFVQLPVINVTKPPCYSSNGNEFIFLVLYHNHFTLLGKPTQGLPKNHEI